MRYKHVCVIGKLRSGKGSVASALKNSRKDFVEMSFADPLKDQAVELINDLWAKNGIDDHMDRGRLEREKGVFRPLLQWLGTDFWREYMDNDQHWIEQFQKEFRHITGAMDLRAVVADCRFPNEAQFARENGFVIVKVERDLSSRLKASYELGGKTEHDGHASEAGIDLIEPDIVIQNDGSLADLNRKVSDLLAFIEGAD
jgi:hypothetical protein